MTGKKKEFSKIITGVVIAISMLVAILSIIEYYVLVDKAIEKGSTVIPDATIPVTCVTIILGALLSYFLYQAGLKNSRNKYGVNSDGEPYKKRKDYEDE